MCEIKSRRICSSYIEEIDIKNMSLWNNVVYQLINRNAVCKTISKYIWSVLSLKFLEKPDKFWPSSKIMTLYWRNEAHLAHPSLLKLIIKVGWQSAYHEEKYSNKLRPSSTWETFSICVLKIKNKATSNNGGSKVINIKSNLHLQKF